MGRCLEGGALGHPPPRRADPVGEGEEGKEGRRVVRGRAHMALGGWKTERMMRRYAAVTDQTLRAAAEAVSEAEAPLSSMQKVTISNI